MKHIAVIIITFLSANAAHADGLKVVMLGTGTPLMKPERSGPGVAIISGEKSYIVDSGAGIVRRAMEASKTIPELQMGKLDTVFLTHLHSDHTTGLSNMILAPWVIKNGRSIPLRLYGPPGTKHMADNIIKAYKDDIDLRINGSQPANTEGCKVISTEFSKNGIIFEDDNITVQAIKVPHGSWEHAYGYKFNEKETGKTVLVSGDTAYSEDIIKAAKGVDILVHEAISDNALKKQGELWQIYHRSFHTLTSEIAEIGKKAKPKTLVLYHQLYWDEDDNNLATEVRAAGYKGNVISANDLDVFE